MQAASSIYIELAAFHFVCKMPYPVGIFTKKRRDAAVTAASLLIVKVAFR